MMGKSTSSSHRRPEPDLSAYIDDLRYVANVLEGEGIGSAVEMAQALIRDAHDLLALARAADVSFAPLHVTTAWWFEVSEEGAKRLPDVVEAEYRGGPADGYVKKYGTIWLDGTPCLMARTMTDGHLYEIQTDRRNPDRGVMVYQSPIDLPGLRPTPPKKPRLK